MTALFLSSVLFRNFRTFGEFKAEIVPSPGLTLLVGTNGLGKSSFFDALEWGLTGEVRRFTSYMRQADQGTYLTRRGAPQGSHSVALKFSDDSEIERGVETRPSTTKIIELLKEPAWTAKIEDVGTYLAFTHFLGQAAQQRFTSRDRSEQWASLKGPSGIDRLDEVRNGLRGRATEMAFNRRIQREKNAIADVERQLTQWQSWSQRLVRLRDAAEAGGAIPTNAFERRMELLVHQVDERVSDYGDDPTATPGDRLALVGEGLESLQRELVSQRSLLESLADIPQRYAVQRAGFGSDDPALAAATSALATAAAEVVAATNATAKARETLEDVNRRLSGVRSEIERLDTARRDLEDATRAAAALASINDDLKKLRAELTHDRGELKSIEAELGAISDRAETIASLLAASARADDLASLADDLAALRNQAAESAALRLQTESDAETARNLLASLTSERDQIQSNLRIARADLESARSRATAVASAVAAIAAHLHDDDTDCPVCRTHFQPGQLQLLANEAAIAQDPALTAADARMAELERNLNTYDQRIAAAKDVLRSAEDAARKADRDQRAVSDLERRITAAVNGAVGDPVAAGSEAQRLALEALSSAQAAAEGDQVRQAEVSKRAVVLRAEVSRLEAQIADLEIRSAAHTADRRLTRERLAAAGFSEADHGRLDSALADAQSRQKQLFAEQGNAEEALQRLLDVEAAARSRQDRANETVRRMTAAREAALEAARALEARWQKSGLEGVPDAAALEAALSRLTHAERDKKQLEDERSLLVRAYEAIVSDQDLQELVADMSRAGGEGAAEDPERYELKLWVNLDAAKDALLMTEKAHQAVNAFADKLRDEAIKFSTQFLSPLNELIDNFNEALLSMPGETVRLNAAYHKDRTQFDMSLRYRDRLDDALYDTDLPPQVVLSEGQLAANGFSILCAASTAYPWSRWRALLLDDPLQHNDIIHAAAFVDLMRNLVELQRYQLIMSSHDRGEAEYIRRKFDAAGLPCSVISLTAPSRFGVRYLPPDHNGPAQSALAKRLARSA